jgi:hypothetical protein
MRKILGLTTLALFVTAGSLYAVPVDKYTFDHIDAKGRARTITVDCAGVVDHYNHGDYVGDTAYYACVAIQ